MSNTQWNLGNNPTPPKHPAYYGVGEYGDTPHQTPDHTGRRVNPLAPAAVVTALLAIFVGVLFSLPWGVLAVALGVVAVIQVRRSQGRQTGVAVALAGVALGLVQIIVWLA